jgi:trimeric autotransporter adhesin
VEITRTSQPWKGVGPQGLALLRACLSTLLAFLLLVVPALAQSVSTLTFNPSPVVGGNTVTGTVTLASAAPAGGRTVTLSTNNSTVVTLPVPPSFVIPQGATQGTFTFNTAIVPSTTNVTVSATTSNTLTATLEVQPCSLAGLYSVSVNPSTTAGGVTVTEQ